MTTRAPAVLKKIICCYLYCRWRPSLSGLCASVSLFPFDFVRAGVVSGGSNNLLIISYKCYHSLVVRHEVHLRFFPGPKRFLAAGSTVPYAGALFGVYFACRCRPFTWTKNIQFLDRYLATLQGSFSSTIITIAPQRPREHFVSVALGNSCR